MVKLIQQGNGEKDPQAQHDNPKRATQKAIRP
jgi:hypothetical protein